MKKDPKTEDHKMEKDALEIFRKVKVPWWAHILGWWRSKHLRKITLRKRRYIATVNVWWRNGDNSYVRSWYICFEYGNGKRTYEYTNEAACLITESKKDNVYPHIIAPWLAGGISNAKLVEISQRFAKQPEPRK